MISPGDRILVTMPWSAPREGEYVEDRGSRARVLLDGDTETCVVRMERVRPVRVVVGVDWAVGPDVSVPIEWPRPPASDAVVALRYAMRAVPKPPKPDRNAAYLSWVRTQMCCSCNATGPNEAHHFGPRGMSQKASDYHAVPLCASCHRLFHDKGEILGRDRPATEECFAFTQSNLLTSWIRRKEGGSETVVTALIAHIREAKT